MGLFEHVLRRIPFKRQISKYWKWRCEKNISIDLQISTDENMFFIKTNVQIIEMRFSLKFKHLTDFVAEEERSENIFSKKFSFVVQKWLKSGKVELKNFSNSHAELFVRWFCFSPELQILSSNFQCKNFFQLVLFMEMQIKRVPPI